MTREVDLGPVESVPPGAIVDVEFDGEQFVVWRTAGGRLCVMDARCPHQWSHLGAEGAVDGEEIVCTSHFWRFDAEGAGVKVAMNGRRDPKADIAVHPVTERDGRMIARLPGG